jgi:hypothetical protein
MGPFSETLQSLLHEIDHQSPSCIPNPATFEQARALYQSAVRVRNTQHPNVVFVVEPNEDNVFDQQKLSTALTNMGATVQFKTLDELREQRIESDTNLILADGSPVDALYWRTGYNLEDYGSDDKQRLLNIRFRADLERKRIALCPTIHHQLATNKWLQMHLSKLSIDQLMTLFKLTTQEAILINMALKVPQQPPESVTHLNSALQSEQWIWKQQGEGGGNVSITPQNVSQEELVGTVLMKKIEPYRTDRRVQKYSQGGILTLENACSELGLFTVGEHQTYGGYLLRTKPRSSLETGVHKGHGMIDTIQIRD